MTSLLHHYCSRVPAEVFALGLMSGTSLDGLDLALVRFQHDGATITFELIAGETVPYSSRWDQALREVPSTTALQFMHADAELGRWMGHAAKQFLATQSYKATIIGSHGHTIFHQPQLGFSTQIGHGGQLAVAAQLPVVSDFRMVDVAMGGQGAPLVPVGDQLLFGNYAACLNLGGIANISMQTLSLGRIAFDICPVNQVLNFLAARHMQSFDAGGELASRGKLLPHLLAQLNELSYYALSAPKSLGREWVEQELIPILDEETHAAEDLLHTFGIHVAEQIAAVVDKYGLQGEVLCTGGGTHNLWLIDQINRKLAKRAWLHVPDQNLVDFKEAILFALLAVLRLYGVPNALASVTGAIQDSCTGAIHDPYGMLS